MDPKLEILFTPLKIGNLEIPNRFLMCPMEGTCIVDWYTECKFKAESHDFFIDRCKDGVGLYIPGMTPLRSMKGDKWLWQNARVFEPVPALMEEMHSYGTKVFFQLGAGWGRSFTMNTIYAKMIRNKLLHALTKNTYHFENLLVSADDGVPNVWMPEFPCRALTTSEIEEYVDAYARTALLCKQAGVDGVEVHAVHEGYLMDQFTMPYTNHRTDKYGGSFENRYRFPVEVVKAIKRLCGEDYPVSLRYSVRSYTKGFNRGAVPGEKFTEVGRTMEESEKAIRYLEQAGYDMFNCDNGTYDAWYWSHPPVYMPPNCNLEDTMHIKGFTSKPVFCAGRMEVDAAAEAIQAGRLDGIGLGRQLLCDEQFITKVREGRREDVRPCISCHISCIPISTWKGGGAEFSLKDALHGKIAAGTCSLNPYTHNEKKYSVVPAAHPKKIAVIGGGIGGMEFAIQASRRGHRVDLYEKTGELGGLFIAAAASECKEKDRALIEWYKRQLKASPVQVHMNTEIRDLKELDAEEIVLATGGTPKTLPVPGGDQTVTVAQALRNETQLGDRVVIIGGGLAGCELAYDLVCKGRHPSIVEMQDDLIKVLYVSAPNSMLMRDLLRFHKVPVYLESRTVEIRKDAVVIEGPKGKREIFADSVVNAIGFNPGSPLAPEKKNPHVHRIGDVENVSNLKNAIWGANDLVLKLSR